MWCGGFNRLPHRKNRFKMNHKFRKFYAGEINRAKKWRKYRQKVGYFYSLQMWSEIDGVKLDKNGYAKDNIFARRNRERNNQLYLLTKNIYLIMNDLTISRDNARLLVKDDATSKIERIKRHLLDVVPEHEVAINALDLSGVVNGPNDGLLARLIDELIKHPEMATAFNENVASHKKEVKAIDAATKKMLELNGISEAAFNDAFAKVEDKVKATNLCLLAKTLGLSVDDAFEKFGKQL